MPDQIDLSKMESIPVMGPNGYLRLHRHWRQADSSMWDDIWGKTPSRDYWQSALNGQMADDYRRIFLKYLPPGGKVLEAGCGVGQVVLALRAHGYNCFGIDYAENTIKLLNQQFPDVPFDHGDIRHLPYANNSFDGYISLGVIEHFSEGQERMLQEAARVVKPGGWLFLSVPALNGWRRFRSKAGLYERRATAPFFEACYSVEELEVLFKDAGFHPVEQSFQNTVMTFAQETIIRPIYLYIEDIRYIRGAVDRLLRLVLPKAIFGHMVMIVAQNAK